MIINEDCKERFLKVSIPEVTVPIQYSEQLVDLVTTFEAELKRLIIGIHTDQESAVYQDSVYDEGFTYFLVRPYDLRDLMKKLEFTFEHIQNPMIVDLTDNNDSLSYTHIKEHIKAKKENIVLASDIIAKVNKEYAERKAKLLEEGEEIEPVETGDADVD